MCKTRRTKKINLIYNRQYHETAGGFFHQVFDEIAIEYPEIENKLWIVAIGATKLAYPNRLQRAAAL